MFSHPKFNVKNGSAGAVTNAEQEVHYRQILFFSQVTTKAYRHPNYGPEVTRWTDTQNGMPWLWRRHLEPWRRPRGKWKPRPEPRYSMSSIPGREWLSTKNATSTHNTSPALISKSPVEVSTIEPEFLVGSWWYETSDITSEPEFLSDISEFRYTIFQ